MSASAILTELAARGIAVQRLCADSRAVRPGDIFVAMPGHRLDGRRFIADAVARGAAAVLYEEKNRGQTTVFHENRGLSPVLLPVPDLAAVSGELAHLVYGRPSERLWLAGVTGTNGKTSVSQWIAQAMGRFDCKCAVIGTLGNGFPGQLADSPNTTPDALSVHRLLAEFADQGAVACAMEVSSIGLDQQRVAGVSFDVAVFTNLTRDHLEYHGSMAAYGEAKAKLFALPGLGAAVVNLDDAFGARLAADLAGRVRTIGYSLEGRRGGDQSLVATDLAMAGAGLSFRLDGKSIAAPLVGRFNAANLLAVIGALLAGDESLDDIAAVLRYLAPPPGRMQALGGEGKPLVVIDYAHTPDALDKALTALRDSATARGGSLVCVFGCGGDRDAGKRPLMGEVAERLADRLLLTSDNPRSEDPAAIIAAIRAGTRTAPPALADRAAAIRTAIRQADARDVILIAGKGHEPYQEVAGVRHPFSDLAEAQAALEARP